MKPNTARPCRHRSSSDMGTRGGDQRRGETRGREGERGDRGAGEGREERHGRDQRKGAEERSRGPGRERGGEPRIGEERAEGPAPGGESSACFRSSTERSGSGGSETGSVVGPDLVGSGSLWVRVSVVGPGLSGGSGSQW
ncbi:Maternal protein tudor [Dissostichus eleginoides]|uniref:Maternal protein tudor n=1 Tax=Dissostichus eleginoides TaxID=100907 RepID=A0AAD9BJP2_DISEL|nr:Maternal protein tudor [Dissostichus eleginoides]